MMRFVFAVFLMFLSPIASSKILYEDPSDDSLNKAFRAYSEGGIKNISVEGAERKNIFSVCFI